MALSVSITKTGGSTRMLQVTSYTQVIDRTPMQAPMPGTDPFTFDLGMFTVQHTINGTVPFVPGTDGSNVIISRRDLEDALKLWYVPGKITLVVNIGISEQATGSSADTSGDTYIGYFKSCRFDT